MLNGKVKVNEINEYNETDFVLLKNEEGEIVIEGITEKAIVLLLSGEPINEPFIQYGPFVMNTKQEIQQAYEDYQSGEFGNPNF